MVEAFTTLPLPFTLLESGNLCGASTCWIAAAKKAWCPECPFLSIDPGYNRRDLKADPQCVQKNLAAAGLADQVTVLEKTGQEAPIRGPVGFVFNDDGKLRSIVSPQHALWAPFLMDGAVLGYHDYFFHTNDPDSSETPPNHRAHVEDLLATGNFEALHLPQWNTNTFSKYEQVAPEELYAARKAWPKSWKYNVAVIRKKMTPGQVEARAAKLVRFNVTSRVEVEG